MSDERFINPAGSDTGKILADIADQDPYGLREDEPNQTREEKA